MVSLPANFVYSVGLRPVGTQGTGRTQGGLNTGRTKQIGCYVKKCIGRLQALSRSFRSTLAGLLVHHTSALHGAEVNTLIALLPKIFGESTLQQQPPECGGRLVASGRLHSDSPYAY